jgi:hypothetical protein
MARIFAYTSAMLQTRNVAVRAVLAALLFTLLAPAAAPAQAGPGYDPSRQELEAVLDDLKAWLPGGWDSFPQIWHERTVRAPVGGEHEHWYRTFALIDAPQVGAVVFYGQINLGGRDGPMMPRSQILYTAVIDEQRGVVNVNGQVLADTEKYEDLHRHPELWKQVRQKDPSVIKCDFIWRRSGAQIVGVLDGKNDERRKAGPGTCSYVTDVGHQQFFADAEWVLSPDELWLYDTNRIEGLLFNGREDRTHVRLYRARSYACKLSDRAGERTVNAYDRGHRSELVGKSGKFDVMLLRALYPDAAGKGMHDRLRLLLTEPGSTRIVASADAAPRAPHIEMQRDGLGASCDLAAAATGQVTADRVTD